MSAGRHHRDDEPPKHPLPVREVADALVAGPFGLLGATAALQQIWQAVHDGETSTVWASVAVIAVLVCLATAWRRHRRKRPADPRTGRPQSRWPAWIVYGSTVVAAASVAVTAVSPLLRPHPGGDSGRSVAGPTSVMPTMSNTPLTPTTVLTTTAVSTSPERADQVVWTSPTPADPPIEPAVGAVTLVGRVTGIPPDHELWVVSKPFGERTDYFVVEGKRQRVGDGSFTAIDYNVGAPTDRAGDGFSYVAVDADDRCSRQLTEASRAAYEKGGDRSRRVTGDLSPGCFLLEPTAIIRFR